MQNFHPLLWALFAIVLLTQVFPFVSTLFQLLRVEMGRIRMTRLAVPVQLSPLHQAAVNELRAIGFEPFAVYTINDSYDDCTAVMLKHANLPAVANIYLRPGSFMSYPVWFWSFAADGAILLTANRQPVSHDMPQVQRVDAYAPTLQKHWQAHEARMAAATLETITPDAAYARIAAATIGYVDDSLAKGRLVPKGDKFFLSYGTALRMTLELMRRRRQLRVPYSTVALNDTYRSTYFAELYDVQTGVKKRLKNRASVSLILLALSLLVSLGLFAWWLDWKSAAAVIIVLLVHECGHALAMRIFGYRDMNMFFIPMMGAVVTGNVKNIPVWKQAIVLLAGPVPGLLFGIAIALNIHAFEPSSFLLTLGINAGILNLFNLLPLSFLDGGKLVEITLLSSWPYALFAFALLSSMAIIGIIVYFKSYNMLFIAFIFLMASRLLWRMARVRSALKKQPAQNLKELFAVTEKTIGVKNFYRQFYIVRSIHEQPAVRPPRAWEMVAVPLLFLACWGVSGLAWSAWNHDRAMEATFDAAVADYYKHYKDGTAKVTAAAQNLNPIDRRQIDALAIVAFQKKGDERAKALLDILELKKEGRSYTRSVITARYLNDAYYAEERLNVPDRIPVLEAALKQIDAAAPDTYAQTVTTRLRIAELRDRAGDTAGAAADLSALLGSTQHADNCNCALRDVIEAQTWFYLDKGDAAKAAAFLEAAPYAAMTKKTDAVGIAYGWALLESGKTAAGATQMQTAAPYVDDTDEGEADNLDLLYAYWKNGQKDKAAAVIADASRNDYCTPDELSYMLTDDLWRRRRSEGIRLAVAEVCAALPPLGKKPQ
ncbi:MAG: site-2 protease family protein [Micavibrio sp.]|nr:site-2 protease family protein [Micavibrio sp.]